MDALTSTDFRKAYAKLTKATLVTVNGHVIGTWVPGPLPDYRFETVTEGSSQQQRTIAPAAAPGFSTQPFTPVPKRRETGR